MRHRYAATLLVAVLSGSLLTGQEQAPVLPSIPGLPTETLQAQWARVPFDTIILVRLASHGGCPVYKVTLHRRVLPVPDRNTVDDQFGKAELQVHCAAKPGFHQAFPESTGDFEGRVHISSLARLSQLVQSSGFLRLEPRYEPTVGWSAASGTDVTVTGPGVNKTVSTINPAGPIDLWGLQEAIDSVAKSVVWTRVSTGDKLPDHTR